MLISEQLTWTRDALERVYDLGFLQRCLSSTSIIVGVSSGKDLQSLLLRLIEQLRPSPDVSSSSIAWRIYNALEHRYVRGLTQTEAANELNISLRQLRREQDRGIEAVATLLFSAKRQTTASPAAGTPHQPQQLLSKERSEYLRLDDLLHAVLGLIDPLLMRKNVDVRVLVQQQTPILWANRTLIRQLFITAISYTIQGANDGVLEIMSDVIDEHVDLTMSYKGKLVSPLETEDDNLIALQRLAEDASVSLSGLTKETPLPAVHLLIPISARQRILMIDDSSDAIELTRRYLANTQFDLVAVSRAEDALMQAQTMQPSCILLDVMMPEHDGWETLALLKSHPATLSIPVVVCSVLRNQELAYALGAAAILPRPHLASQLIEMLQNVTARPM